MKKTPLKPKKIYTLKKTSLKKGKSTGLKVTSKLNKTSKLSKENSILQKAEINKQNEKNKQKWEEVRQKVIERDKGKCQICGKKAAQVHHIHLRSKRKDLIYNMNNLILLCDKHHFHRGSEKYYEQTLLIANSKNITVEELLKKAEENDNG